MYKPIISEPDYSRAEIQSLLGKAIVQRNIETVLSLDDFIAPLGEAIKDDSKSVEEYILEYIVEAYDDDDDVYEEDAIKEDPIRMITLNKAIEAMKIRIMYEEQYGDDEGVTLLQLERDLRQLLL